MLDINKVASAVDGAVHQQAGATGEISKNVVGAAEGTKHVVAELAGVADAAAQTRKAAEDVLDCSQTVEDRAGELRREVEGFLRQSRGLTVTRARSTASKTTLQSGPTRGS